MIRRSLLLLALALPALAAAQTVTVEIRPLSPSPTDTTDHIDLGTGATVLSNQTGVLVAVVRNATTHALLSGQRVTWTSDNPNIASISGTTANGTATGRSYGATRISATVQGVTASTTACVFDKLAPVTVLVAGPIPNDTVNFVHTGSTLHFTASDGRTGNALPSPCIHWTVDNRATALIDRRGNAIGVAPSKTRVNAFLGVLARP